MKELNLLEVVTATHTEELQHIADEGRTNGADRGWREGAQTTARICF